MGFFRQLLSEPLMVEPEAFDCCPVLLVHPAADRWTPAALSERFAARISKVDTTVTLLDRAGHFPVEEPGVHQMVEAVRQFLVRVERSMP